MRKANILMHGLTAGVLKEGEDHQSWRFDYLPDYDGPPVSLTMPTTARSYHFGTFPPFFEGLLPEGIMLDGLLRKLKIDRNDYFSQLVATGADLVGAVTVEIREDGK